jgi:hypothetical protein
MGLLALLAKLPFLPISVLLRTAEVVRQETERQYHDPARVRRELEEAQHQREVGDMSEDELSRVEYAATGRLLGGAPVNRRQPGNRR